MSEMGKRESCYFHDVGHGYESHSRCVVYGGFRCGICERYVSRDDIASVRDVKVRECLNALYGFVNRIEKEVESMKKYYEVFDKVLKGEL